MRIIKLFHEFDGDDDVQIIYESPSDEDCQFIQEVNPSQSQSSKASCSRTSVITGRKRPAVFPISRENAAFKKPALEAGNSEQTFDVQPTTSQHSGESTIQNSGLWQQPSNSGQTGSIELPQNPDGQSSDSVSTVLRIGSIILMQSGETPTQIYSDNGNQQQWSVSLNQQGETFEQYSQGSQEQAISMLSNIGILEDVIVENITEQNVASVNQQSPVFEHNYWATEQQAIDMITEPNIQENINITQTEALMNQQQDTFEENNSQEIQSQGMSITTQPNANTTQESIEMFIENNSFEPIVIEVISKYIEEQPRASEQNSEEPELQTISMTTHSNTHAIQESINVANDSDYQYRAIPNQQQPEQFNTPETQPQTMNATNIVQEGFVTSDTGQLGTFEATDSQRQMTSSEGENRTNPNVSSNQIPLTTVPLELTQPNNIAVIICRSILNSSLLKKASQHHVWTGSIKYCKKPIASALIQPLTCSIFGLMTVSGSMNVNADLWPRQLNQILLPSQLLLKQDLCKEFKNIDRHVTVYFEPVKSDALKKLLCHGWMCFIRFPPPCHKDFMIVLHVPQKSAYIGFIVNNKSGFISKFFEVCKKYGLKKLPKTFQLSGSHQVQTPPQPTSLPLPAHQQPSLSPITHQQLRLTSYGSYSLTSHQCSQPQLPTIISSSSTHAQRSLSNLSTLQITSAHLPTSVASLSSPLQTSLPQSSHVQTNLLQSPHVQTSLPQCSHAPPSLPQSSLVKTNLPQSSHEQTNLPQSSHLQTQPSTVLTCLPRTQQRMNPFQPADSLQKRVMANKYETVDRHIDACISALHQQNQLSQGAGPSTSQQTQTANQQVMKQESGTNKKTLIMLSGTSNYLPSSSAKLLESQASEIFSPSLVKKIIKKKFKATKESFNSVQELCEAILAYEENKRKNKESKKLKSDANEALLCKICMDEQMNIVFEPCGHLSTCLECAQPLHKCPMCRTLITHKRKIYLS